MTATWVRTSNCGFSERKTEWTNVDHRYRRVREEWRECCRWCHRNADKALRKKLGTRKLMPAALGKARITGTAGRMSARSWALTK
jgi:hypothetical protein